MPDDVQIRSGCLTVSLTVVSDSLSAFTVWDVARDLGWNLVEEDCKEGWNLFWTDMSVSAERAMKMNHLQVGHCTVLHCTATLNCATQRINHFPGMHEIARKNGLARNLNKIAKVY